MRTLHSLSSLLFFLFSLNGDPMCSPLWHLSLLQVYSEDGARVACTITCQHQFLLEHCISGG